MTGKATTLGSGSIVQVGAWQLAASTAAVIGGIWIVATFTVGGLRDDVGTIRKSVTDLQSGSITTSARVSDAEAKALDRIRDAETKFGDQSVALQKELISLGGKFGDLGNRVAGLDARVTALDGRMIALDNSMTALTNRIGLLDSSMKVLGFQMTDLQKQLASVPPPTNWSDPKLLNDLIERVRSVINDPNQKILIVPYGGTIGAQGPR